MFLRAHPVLGWSGSMKRAANQVPAGACSAASICGPAAYADHLEKLAIAKSEVEAIDVRVRA